MKSCSYAPDKVVLKAHLKTKKKRNSVLLQDIKKAKFCSLGGEFGLQLRA